MAADFQELARPNGEVEKRRATRCWLWQGGRSGWFLWFCSRQSDSTRRGESDCSLFKGSRRSWSRREGGIGANGRASFKPLDPAHGVVVLLQTRSGFPTSLIMRSYDPDPRDRDSRGKRYARGAGERYDGKSGKCCLLGMPVERDAMVAQRLRECARHLEGYRWMLKNTEQNDEG